MKKTSEFNDIFYSKEFGDTLDLTRNLKREDEAQHETWICIFRLVSLVSLLLFVLSCLVWSDVISLQLCSGNVVNKPVPVALTCNNIPDIEKIDCYPDAPVTESECLKRGCCYSVHKSTVRDLSFPPLNVPYCYYSTDFKGYVIKNVEKTPLRIKVNLERIQPSGFPKDVSNLNLLVTFIDDYILRIKITDKDSQRFEVPIELKYLTKDPKDSHYDVNIDPSSGVLTVKRKSTKSVIFNTNLSRLVYSDQFLQLTSDLPSPHFYGIGEHYDKLLRNVNWTRFTLINSDLPPVPNHGLYGSHPFYMALEKDGKASGVFLFNSNVMDVILQPSPAVTFRPIGGIFDFFIMLGPSPKDVTKQYSSIVGKTFMPPFWSLGFQLCRFGYKTLNKTRETMQRNIDAEIPLDVQWNDIDYMEEYKDFTYDKVNFNGLPKFVDDLHSEGRHYVIMTDPGISNSEKSLYLPYVEGVDDDVFVKNANGSIFVGKVWTDGTTVFPDFSHPAAKSFWIRQFRRFQDEVKFDGVWIDMNEPSNFWNGGSDGCPYSPLENPQYVPGQSALRTKTVCMSAKHYYTTHYNEHNIYGYREAVATNEALRSVRKKRPFIISRATFPGQGVHSGHWSGDVYSTWEDMRYTIPSLINFNMYAMPMIGSDICGFNGNTTVELCARWQSLGAFYPFSRNHNERVTIEQDPVALGSTVIEATKNSLKKRYALLTYLYTLFYRSHVFGDTVVRPLFFEFPDDPNTYSIDEQFLWGSSVMIIPVLYPNTTTVQAYFPKGLWYDEDGLQRNSSGETAALTIPITDIRVNVKGGIILPAQVPALTTTELRNSPYILAVALDEQQQACGELYWDDGDSLSTYENRNYNLIYFEASNGKLNSTVINKGYQANMILKLIQFAGLKEFPSKVTLNGVGCTSGPTNVSLHDTVNKDSSSIKNIAFFGMNAIFNEHLLDGATCMFYKYKNFFTIQTNAISLLSPLDVSWN